MLWKTFYPASFISSKNSFEDRGVQGANLTLIHRCDFECAMRDLVVENENAHESDINDDVSGTHVRTCDWMINLSGDIIDLRELMLDKIRKDEVFVSLELFPTEKNQGLYNRVFSETSAYSPLFYSLTWHSKPSTDDHAALKLIENFPANTMLHIAARGFKRNDMERILEKAIASGVRSIFALQGDYADEDGDFPHAVDLVSFIRERYGSTFCICVAGYPQTHPHSSSKELDLLYLKKKVDAGADFIISQLFFESSIFIDFVKDCRSVGITVPILPGIFPIMRYRTLQRMAEVCNIEIPEYLSGSLNAIKDDDKAVFNFGVEFAAGLISDILSSNTACGFHIFTLNEVEITTKLCERINILKENRSRRT